MREFSTWRSPDPPTIAEILCHHAARHGDRVAFFFEGRATTYTELNNLCNRVAHGLSHEGVDKRARVAIVDKNSDRFFQVVFGCAKANVACVTVNWRLAPGEIEYIVDDSHAEILFVGHEFLAQGRVLCDRLPRLRLLVCLTGPTSRQGVRSGVHTEQSSRASSDWSRSPARVVEFATWRDSFPATEPDAVPGPDDVVVQMYTSGTTGRPKGVQISNRGLTFLVAEQQDHPDMAWNAWGRDDASLVSLPTFHIAGTGWCTLGLIGGAINVILPKFDPDRVLEAIECHRITRLVLVPAALQQLLRHPRARFCDYSAVRYVVYGASPISPELLREGVEVFGCGFVQIYGLTECSGMATYLPARDHDTRGNPRMRSAGKPLPGVELKIVGPDGHRLRAGETGEVHIRSPGLMVEYWNQPDKTRAVVDKGWLRTGDAGCMDADGYLYIQDRIDDMIISGGENIYPIEVENALSAHDAVADVAVIGVPDQRWGETVKAFVALERGRSVSSAELIAFARQHIAAYKLPTSIEYVSRLPRNAAGKVLKRELRLRMQTG
ncbi:MAG: fatty acid--CoA ligase [Proteobacteria bacterium]|nr:fatty acid--CoA ligase [Pseudomonadota bacterium]